MSASQESLISYPCSFPIKIMGRRESGFTSAVLEIVRRHAPDFAPGSLTRDEVPLYEHYRTWCNDVQTEPMSATAWKERHAEIRKLDETFPRGRRRRDVPTL